MFDLFRSRAKAVRYFLGALLMVVAASMVITLIPGWGTVSSNQDQVIAEIGKEAITTRDVQQQMQMAQRNRAFPAEMAGIFAQQLIDEMITTRAVLYEARRMGLIVTDADLARTLRNFPMLFPGGQFVGRDVYQQWVNQQGMTIPEFEGQLRQQLLMGRLTNLVSESVVVTPDEIAREYKRRNDKIKLDYINISLDKVKNDVSVTPDEIRNYYERNKAQYRIPEKRSFDLLVVDEAKVAQKINFTDDELRRIYDANKDQYRTPERVKVRHILLKTTDVPADQIPKIQARAEDLLAQIKKGADFAELAKKNSDDPGSASKGGDLGWIVRGQTVPQFESTAFSLKPGELSNVIKTDYGFHILQVLEKEPARLKPFEEVKDQIAKEKKQQQVFDQMQQIAERVRGELQKNPQQAQQIASRNDLAYYHVDSFSPGGTVPEFGNNPDFNDAVSSTPQNGVTQVMQAPGNKLAVAVVTGVQPERQAELPDVQDQIRQQIVSMKAMDLLNKRAADALAKAKADGGDLKKVAQSMGLEVKSTQEFTQDGAADGIGPATAVRQGFEEPVGAVFGPVPVSDGRFICKVANRIPADMGKLPEQRAGVVAALKQQKGRQQVELFMDSVRNALTREGKVKIHQDVFDRVINSYKG